MPTTPLGLARAQEQNRLLEQYLISCPACRRPAAVHLSVDGPDGPRLVRHVCPLGCPVSEAEVLSALPNLTAIELVG
jgi:hypothetical protein